GARGFADAVRAVAEVDLVQVEVEDLLLREPLLDAAREHHLADLARVGALGREQQALHHLLRDRARALDLAAREQVLPRGARDAREVDSLVLEERPVLRRHERVDHVFGYVGERDQPAPLLEELADRAPVAIDHLGDELRAIVRDAVRVGEIAQEQPVERRAAADPHATDETAHTAQHARRRRTPGRQGSHRLSRGNLTVAEPAPRALPLHRPEPGFPRVNATPPLSIAFVMDPIASIDIRADTTFVLMLEA